MNASEIIGEIAALSPEEQQKIIRFTRKLEEEGPLNPSELGALAQRLAGCADDREADALKQKITNGFYGGAHRAKVRRQSLPSALLEHLLDRVRLRTISYADLESLARWLDSQPEVPQGRWYKRFPGMSVCGEGELIKTLLAASQTPVGEEVG